MNIDTVVFRLAGVLILISLLLGYYHSRYWLWLTAFVGPNMLQASFTGFCPLARILATIGIEPGAAFGAQDAPWTEQGRGGLRSTKPGARFVSLSIPMHCADRPDDRRWAFCYDARTNRRGHHWGPTLSVLPCSGERERWPCAPVSAGRRSA